MKPFSSGTSLALRVFDAQKESVVSLTALTKERRIRQLLHVIHLGHKKPSQLLW